MPRHSQPKSPSQHLNALKSLLSEFESELKKPDLRPKVLSLVPVFYELRDLGGALIPPNLARNARDRILQYLLKYPQLVISGDELMVVSGIGEWARRVRELRVQFGWYIISGVTIKQMTGAGEQFDFPALEIPHLGPDDYFLVSAEQDKEAAHRWNVAHEIRNSNKSVQDKLLEYFRANVSRLLTGEELSYVAKGRTEWARRVRELRTEEGWPIITKNTGRPDLPIGVYVLEQDRQLPTHDRHISDGDRITVLERDSFQCTNPTCKWNYDKRKLGDPRQLLELHHLVAHADKGSNTPENLITLCNVCHDRVHANDLTINWS